MTRIILVFGVLIKLFSCSSKSLEVSRVKNDTLILIENAVAMVSTGEHMPGAGPLKVKYRFGDSILLTSAVLSPELLPSNLNGQHYKVVPLESICPMLTADSAVEELPNYLSVHKFEKNDTGYFVQMMSRSCMDFGGGGSLMLFYKKVGDSLTLVDQSASSLN
jgi:hypothetical protein